MPPDRVSLSATEHALFASITGHGWEPGLSAAATDLVIGDGRASAEERLHVYAHMYRARLVEALEAEFPRLARHLGPEPFGRLVAAYAIDHPSRNPSLRLFGQHLAAWLGRPTADVPAAPLLADLARLEWARSDVFDGVDEPLLTLAALRTVRAEDFGFVPLRLITTSRLVKVDAAVPALWAAIGGLGESPARAGVPRTGAGGTGAVSVLVWRQGPVVYHRAVDAAECAALAGVARGSTFGAVCETLAESFSADQATARAFGWLSTWLADELLSSAS